MNHVRALLLDSGLPRFLWKEGLKFAMWIRNRTTTHQLGGRTPYEAFYGTKPDMADIHLWGSRVWVRDLTAGKLDARGREGRFMGYDANNKGCRIYWPNSRTIGVERDLIFEDRPTDHEHISLPLSFPTRDKPAAVTVPRTEQPTIETLKPESDAEDQLAPTLVPPNNSTAEPPGPAPVEDSSPADEVEPTDLPAKRVRKPTPLLREILEGRADGGSARSKSRIPRGAQLPTGMAATEDNHEVGLEHFAHESHIVEAALASTPDVGTTDEDPTSLAEARSQDELVKHVFLQLLDAAENFPHLPRLPLKNPVPNINYSQSTWSIPSPSASPSLDSLPVTPDYPGATFATKHLAINTDNCTTTYYLHSVTMRTHVSLSVSTTMEASAIELSPSARLSADSAKTPFVSTLGVTQKRPALDTRRSGRQSLHPNRIHATTIIV